MLSANVTTQPDGETRRVAFKRYTNASAAARAHELEALRKFGGSPGVVSLVASGGIANDGSDIEWIATEPVGKALSQMCLCSSATRRAVVRALGDGPVAALSTLHEQGHLFADIHDGNIILSTPADDESDGGDDEDGAGALAPSGDDGPLIAAIGGGVAALLLLICVVAVLVVVRRRRRRSAAQSDRAPVAAAPSRASANHYDLISAAAPLSTTNGYDASFLNRASQYDAPSVLAADQTTHGALQQKRGAIGTEYDDFSAV